MSPIELLRNLAIDPKKPILLITAEEATFKFNGSYRRILPKFKN
jgi:hypothetical protein